MARRTVNNVGANRLESGFVGDALYDDLRGFCRDAEAHQRLASERALSREYSLSHATVRRVLARLVDEGTVYKVHGKGVFVAELSPSASVVARDTVLYVDNWGDSNHGYCVRKLEGALAAAELAGISLQVHRYEPGCANDDVPFFMAELEAASPAGIIVPWMSGAYFRAVRAFNPRLQIVSTGARVSIHDISTVMWDRFAAGQQAADWLHEQSVASVRLLAADDNFVAGFNHANKQMPHPMYVEYEKWAASDIEPGRVRGIAAAPEDAVVFDDDRVAVRTLDMLSMVAVDWQRERIVMSQANRGEDIVPPSVARIEVDGYEIGYLALSMLKSRLHEDQQSAGVVRVAPRIVKPT